MQVFENISRAIRAGNAPHPTLRIGREEGRLLNCGLDWAVYRFGKGADCSDTVLFADPDSLCIVKHVPQFIVSRTTPLALREAINKGHTEPQATERLLEKASMPSWAHIESSDDGVAPANRLDIELDSYFGPEGTRTFIQDLIRDAGQGLPRKSFNVAIIPMAKQGIPTVKKCLAQLGFHNERAYIEYMDRAFSQLNRYMIPIMQGVHSCSVEDPEYKLAMELKQLWDNIHPLTFALHDYGTDLLYLSPLVVIDAFSVACVTEEKVERPESLDLAGHLTHEAVHANLHEAKAIEALLALQRKIEPWLCLDEELKRIYDEEGGGNVALDRSRLPRELDVLLSQALKETCQPERGLSITDSIWCVRPIANRKVEEINIFGESKILGLGMTEMNETLAHSIHPGKGGFEVHLHKCGILEKYGNEWLAVYDLVANAVQAQGKLKAFLAVKECMDQAFMADVHVMPIAFCRFS